MTYFIVASSVLFALLLDGVARRRGGNAPFWSAMGFFFGPLALALVWIATRPDTRRR